MKTPAWIQAEIDSFKDLRPDATLATITVSASTSKGVTQVIFRRPGSGRKAWITHFSAIRGHRRNDWSVTKAYSEDALHSDNTIRNLSRAAAAEQALWHIL